jgi:hypothetical protein
VAFLSAQHLAPAQGSFEPQRQYDWALEIALDDAGDQVVVMQGLESFEVPKEENEEIELHYANEVRYVAGKARFDALPLTLKDFVDVGVARAIIKWRRQVYNPETGAIGLARDYKKNADLVLVAPDQSSLRIWKLIGCWPQRLEGGSLDMTSNEKVLVTVTIRFDRAIPGAGLTDGLGGINVGSLTAPL